MWRRYRSQTALPMSGKAKVASCTALSAPRNRHVRRNQSLKNEDRWSKTHRPMIPSVVPPLPTENKWSRSLRPADALEWLSDGWKDFWVQPVTSLGYGVLVFLVSISIVAGLYLLGLDYILFPAFAGLMVVRPISAFSIPMLLNERTDALTAMGSSMALVWNNLPAMLTWGAIVLALFLFSLATGLVGLIVVFPLLGHGTWHAYQAVAR